MKAYIVTLKLRNMEVPWTDNEWCGPNYATENFSWLVVAETASKAKYIALSTDDYLMELCEYEFTFGDLLCWAKVCRTKRKYIYTRENIRLLKFYRDSFLRTPYPPHKQIGILAD